MFEKLQIRIIVSFCFLIDLTSHKNIIQFIKRIFISEKTITQFLSGKYVMTYFTLIKIDHFIILVC